MSLRSLLGLKPKRTGHAHDFTRSYWGHSIAVDKVDRNRIKGHGWGGTGRTELISLDGSAERPRIGDWVRLKDVNGYEWRYLVTKVDYADNVRDMFFFEAVLDQPKAA